jgi:hypothetical protein
MKDGKNRTNVRFNPLLSIWASHVCGSHTTLSLSYLILPLAVDHRPSPSALSACSHRSGATRGECRCGRTLPRRASKYKKSRRCSATAASARSPRHCPGSRRHLAPTARHTRCLVVVTLLSRTWQRISTIDISAPGPTCPRGRMTRR